MTSKWQTLFEEVEIIDSGFDSEIWNIDKIYEFEKNTEITLPEDYKEFCQVFGTGKFGNYVNIYCPSAHGVTTYWDVRQGRLLWVAIAEKI